MSIDGDLHALIRDADSVAERLRNRLTHTSSRAAHLAAEAATACAKSARESREWLQIEQKNRERQR